MARDYLEARNNALVTARNYFQYGANNLLYAEWRKSAIEKFSFYDGAGQYTPDEINELKARGQRPIVVNKIKNMINQISGIERRNRTRTATRSHKGDDESERLAKALTHVLYYIQESQNIPQKRSDRNMHSLICGLGWDRICYQDGQTFFDNIYPLNIIYDADDFSTYMNNQQYICALHWIGREDLKILYPHLNKKIDELFSSIEPMNVATSSDQFLNRISPYIDQYGFGSRGVGGKILVIEVQRKERKKYFCGIDLAGHYFDTFNEEEAYQMVASKNDIQEKMGYQILRTVFCRDLVLEHAPLKPNIPNLPDFLYIPCVYGRLSATGIPDGWMTPMMDLQRLLNYSKVKEDALRNSNRMIADATAFFGQTKEEVRQEVARSDGILIKNPDSEVTIHQNADLAESQINAARRLDEEFQQVSGMFADALGAPSNATSGVAINSRARLSITNQTSAFDIFELTNKREARMILNLIQGSGEENILAQILSEDDYEEIVLNQTREIKGKKYIFNDVRTLPLDIYIEPTHDYESGPEEQRTIMENILSNPNAQQILQSPALLKLTGARDWKKISDEMQQINQQNQQMEQMAQAGVPIPQQESIDQSPFSGLNP